MKAVLISIQPKWCNLIASGKKTVEIRKTRPKLETPFKCYIYETKGKIERPHTEEDGYIYQEGRGTVIGEFVCDTIFWNGGSDLIVKEDREKATRGSCVSREELFKYLRIVPGTSMFDKRCEFYCWHISSLKIYDKPKTLKDFKKTDCKCPFPYVYEPPCENCDEKALKRPPQSWCYVEELNAV